MKYIFFKNKILFNSIFSIVIILVVKLSKCQNYTKLLEYFNLIKNLSFGNSIRFCKECICIKSEYQRNKVDGHNEDIFLCLVNKNLYVLNETGTIISNLNLTSDLDGNYYNIISNNDLKNLLDSNNNNPDQSIYFLIYFVSNSNIKLNYYNLTLENPKNEQSIPNSFLFDGINENFFIDSPEDLSCQIINSNKIICFLINNNTLYAVSSINPNISDMGINDEILLGGNIINKRKVVRSSLSNNNNLILIAWQTENNDSYYSFYNLTTNTFETNPQIFENCDKNNIIIETYSYSYNVKRILSGGEKRVLAAGVSVPKDIFLFICKNEKMENGTFNIFLKQYNSNFTNFITKANNTLCYDRNINNIFFTYDSGQPNEKYDLIYFSCDKTINNPSTNIQQLTSELTTTKINILNISQTIFDYNPFKTTLISKEYQTEAKTNIINTISTFPKSELITTIMKNQETNIPIIPKTIINYNSFTTTIPNSEYETEKTTIIQEETEINSKTIIIENIPNITISKKEELLQNITNILSNTTKGKTYQLSGSDFNLIIKPTNVTLSPYSTRLDFSECESVLRNHYNISNSSYITLLQLELDNNNSKSLVNQLEYMAYDDNNKELDLDLCNEVSIQVYYAIKDNSSIDISTISSFKDIGIDVFNINDIFFTDICTPYSEEENDLILEDRIKYIYQNYSLCEEGCTYIGINLEYLTVECECNVKNNLTIMISPLNLDEMVESPSGFEIIKCYNLVFSKNNKMKNYGFWLFTILLGLHVPLLAFYFYIGINPLFIFILNQMIRYGYIKKFDPRDTSQIDIPPPNMVYIKNKNKNNYPPKKKTQNNKDENNNELIDKSSVDNKKSSEREINENNRSNDKDNILKKKENKKEEKTKALVLNNSNISKSECLKINLNNNLNDNLSKLNNIKTQDSEQKINNNLMEFNLINIDINIKKNRNYVPRSSNRILNNYNYEEAVKYDRRELCNIFYIYLLSKQVLFHTFCFKSPLELLSLRLILLIFIISSDFALNAFFYFKDNISKKFRKSKNLILFSLSDNIGIIFLSTIIGFILLSLFTKLSNTKGALRKIFRDEEEKMKKDGKYVITEERKKEIKKEIESVLKKFKLKVLLLIIIELIFMMFFWYYVTAFCHVYQSTQISWILDSIISMIFRIIIDFLICLGLAKMYRFAVDINIECIYNICLFLYDFD